MLKKFTALAVALLFVLATAAYASRIKYGSTSQSLAAAVLDYTYNNASSAQVLWVSIKASGAITETVTITLDSELGTNYDTVLKTQSLTAATSFFWMPEGDLILAPNDGIRVQCTNGGGVETIYVTVKVMEGMG